MLFRVAQSAELCHSSQASERVAAGNQLFQLGGGASPIPVSFAYLCDNQRDAAVLSPLDPGFVNMGF